MQSIIEIKKLYYRYEKDVVLEDINITIPFGSFLAIVGPNGSGKSTLLKLILGLLKPQKGEINLFGKEINKFKDWQKNWLCLAKGQFLQYWFPCNRF